MTEIEWIECNDPDMMFQFLRGDHPCDSVSCMGFHGHISEAVLNMQPCRISRRKLRLLACACCRRIWDWLEDERSRRAVVVSERFADEETMLEELNTAKAEAMNAFNDILEKGSGWRSMAFAARAAAEAANNDIPESAVHSTICACLERGYDAPKAAAARINAKLLIALIRDIFDNLPFRKISIAHSVLNWQNRTIANLAKNIYKKRAFCLMPILADAIEDTGFYNEDILSHCRDKNILHVRGCWVIDVLLGKI